MISHLQIVLMDNISSVSFPMCIVFIDVLILQKSKNSFVNRLIYIYIYIYIYNILFIWSQFNVINLNFPFCFLEIQFLIILSGSRRAGDTQGRSYNAIRFTPPRKVQFLFVSSKAKLNLQFCLHLFRYYCF